MGAFQSSTTTIGLLALVALLLFLLYRYLGGWTRIKSWIVSSREEKMVLTTRGGTTGHFNPNGYLVPSDSDLNISGGGSFRRFQNTESSDNRPNGPPTHLQSGQSITSGGQFPQAKYSSTSSGHHGYLPTQGSVDSVFVNPLGGALPPKIPPPPPNTRTGSGSSSGGTTSTGGGGLSSSTNPFIPLIQASTQFFSQTIQSFQNASPAPSGNNNNISKGSPNPSSSNERPHSSYSSTSNPGISTGELLFSSPPLYNTSSHSRTHKDASSSSSPPQLINFNEAAVMNSRGQVSSSSIATNHSQPMYYGSGSSSSTTTDYNSSLSNPTPLSPPSHPISSMGRGPHTLTGRILFEDAHNLILIETNKDLIEDAERQLELEGREASLLETMRAEIRLENERMEDATKSLLEDNDDVMQSSRSKILLNNARSFLGSSQEKGDDRPTTTMDSVRNNEQPKSSTSSSSSSYKPSSSSTSTSYYLDRPISSDRKYSAPEIGYGVTQTQQHPVKVNIDGDGAIIDPLRPRKGSMGQVTTIGSNFSSTSNSNNSTNFSNNNNNSTDGYGTSNTIGTCDSGISSNGSSSSVIPITQANSCTSPSYVVGPSSASPSATQRTRSFSLRQQSSVDSIGDISDLMSPDSSGGSLPAIQRAMSCDSVCSDTSVILGDLDPPHVTGQLFIGLEYDSETADLIVNVIEGKELLGLDPDPTSPFDSYVRVYLLPDKTTNMQTRIYRKSLNPFYKEKFMFGLELSELPTRSLVFYLYATNKFSNTLIGEAELKLNELELGQQKTTWLTLTDTGKRGGELGEIMFSLSYLPTAERLTVVVVKARNLKFPHQRETGDPFVKVYLLQKGKKVSKKKSSTKRNEKNPIFNEAMIFSVPTHALQTIQLRITVSDSSESDGRAYSIGHIIVGSASAGKPLSHWSQMLASLRKPIAMWHSLRK